MRVQRLLEKLFHVIRIVGRAIRRVLTRLHPMAIQHILYPELRAVIKFSGIANNEHETQYFLSFYHFVHDILTLSPPKNHDYLIV